MGGLEEVLAGGDVEDLAGNGGGLDEEVDGVVDVVKGGAGGEACARFFAMVFVRGRENGSWRDGVDAAGGCKAPGFCCGKGPDGVDLFGVEVGADGVWDAFEGAVDACVEEGDDVGVWEARVDGLCNANGAGVVGLDHSLEGCVEFKGACG